MVSYPNIDVIQEPTKALFTHKKVRINGKDIQTPTAAIEAKRITSKDPVATDARGVNELHRTFSKGDIEDARDGKSEKISDNLGEQYRNTEDGELTCVILEYTSTEVLEEKDITFLIDLVEPFADFATILMPELLRNIDRDEGLRASRYQVYKDNILSILESSAYQESTVSFMGVFSPLGWTYVNDLLDEYLRRDVRSFCFNFDRRKVTAMTQVQMLQPFFRLIGTHRLFEDIFLYAINVDRGHDASMAFDPAEDFLSLGMGFDVLGGNHVTPNYVPEESEDAEDTFLLFDKDEYVYREVPLSDLKKHFPSDSSLDPDRIAKMYDHARYRHQALLAAEQMALASDPLRSAIERGEAFDHTSTKAGVGDRAKDRMLAVKKGYDAGNSQTDLTDF